MDLNQYSIELVTQTCFWKEMLLIQQNFFLSVQRPDPKRNFEVNEFLSPREIDKRGIECLKDDGMSKLVD